MQKSVNRRTKKTLLMKFFAKKCKSIKDLHFFVCQKLLFRSLRRVRIVCYSLVRKEERSMNQLILVGRLTKDPMLKRQDGKSNCFITVAVKRQFKNSDGIYETDFISCTVWNVIAEKVCEYCKKGDVVSIKARIQNNNYVDKDDNKVYAYEIIADQVSFMTSQKSREDPDDDESEEICEVENKSDNDELQELTNAE